MLHTGTNHLAFLGTHKDRLAGFRIRDFWVLEYQIFWQDIAPLQIL